MSLKLFNKSHAFYGTLELFLYVRHADAIRCSWRINEYEALGGGGDFEEGMTQLQVQKARYSATFFLPQIPHRLIWDLAGAFAVRSSH